MVSPNEIQSLDEDWGRDERDPEKRPFSMRAVQAFLKKIIADNELTHADLNQRLEQLEINSAKMHEYAMSEDVMNSIDNNDKQTKQEE